MMNAEKSFKALVKTARAHNFKVSFFRGPDCGIDGNIFGTSIRINSSRSYETRLKTLVLLLSKYDFFGLSAHIAFFALNIATAIQAG